MAIISNFPVPYTSYTAELLSIHKKISQVVYFATRAANPLFLHYNIGIKYQAQLYLTHSNFATSSQHRLFQCLNISIRCGGASTTEAPGKQWGSSPNIEKRPHYSVSVFLRVVISPTLDKEVRLPHVFSCRTKCLDPFPPPQFVVLSRVRGRHQLVQRAFWVRHLGSLPPVAEYSGIVSELQTEPVSQRALNYLSPGARFSC